MQRLTEKNRVTVIRDLTEVVPNLKTSFGVIRIGLFGSVIRGEQTNKSDIDILVEFKDEYKTLKNYVALVDYLESFFDSKVDLVTLESLEPYIQQYILNEVVWTPE
ncbi:nucleotidyltransferase family protein [Methanospirillum lacunae]|uniref:protein adenylyltransferase n=1 Tax=Methanospirillum lacunae TaxID=668570 RepID=A0A2V2N265_9EURY|nr:nucleotidyltransferase family protein [Methanospirillum lacunae]PWR74192.1 nucleotidyltransferase [Methanospirillum lacunae]